MMNDLRLALRTLRQSPGVTAVAVASMALGIGANTATFSLVNAILLRSLPVPNPQELRVIQWSGVDPKTGVASVMKLPRIEVGNGHADPAADRMLYRRPLLILLSGR